MKSISSTFVLGGLVIEIRSPESLPFLHQKRFAPFHTNASPSAIHVEYQIIEPGTRITTKKNPLSGLSQVRVKRLSDDDSLLYMPQVEKCLAQARRHWHWSAIEIHHAAVTLLDFKENRADIFFSQAFVEELGDHGIGPAMLAPFLPRFDACLLHASAVGRRNRAAIFLAPDEGGKTTAARLSADGVILGDDQVLVRRIPEGFQVSGTPWGLHTDAKLQVPLAGLFLLEKARNFSLTPLSARDLVPPIWEEVKHPLSVLPWPLKKKAFNLICDLAASIPARKLSFTRDHIDWQAIDETMAAGGAESPGSTRRRV